MEEDQLVVGNRYRCRTNGLVYELVALAQLKHPETREWIPSVVYECARNQNKFVRTLPDFLRSFMPA